MKKYNILFLCVFLVKICNAQEIKKTKTIILKYAPIQYYIWSTPFNFELEKINKKPFLSTTLKFGYHSINKEQIVARGGLIGKKDLETIFVELGEKIYYDDKWIQKNMAGFYLQPSFRFEKYGGYEVTFAPNDAIYEIDFDSKYYHFITYAGFQYRFFNRLNFDFSYGLGLTYNSTQYEYEYIFGFDGFDCSRFISGREIKIEKNESDTGIKGWTIPSYWNFTIGWAF